MRCYVDGASGQVTMMPSICNVSAFCKSSVYAVKDSCLTPGDLPGAPGIDDLPDFSSGQVIFQRNEDGRSGCQGRAEGGRAVGFWRWWARA